MVASRDCGAQPVVRARFSGGKIPCCAASNCTRKGRNFLSSRARLLIIDDEPDQVRLMTRILQTAGYSHIEGLSDAADSLNVVRDFAPDLILLDLRMDGIDGFEVLSQLRRYLPADEFLPVLVVTSEPGRQSRERALSLGATDFLSRPFEIFDVILRVRNLLQTRFLHLELMARNELLEAQVLERTRKLAQSQEELKLAQLDVIDRLAHVGEHHDDDTGAHTRRVARTARLLAQRLGLESEAVEMIRRAAPLHDVGKIGVSDTILQKPARLTPGEFSIIQRHCQIGAALLSDGRSELLRVARTIALSHHERFDGSGYPQKLAGEEIPIEGRIVAVADVFDALTHNRPYKEAWSVAQAVAEIENQSAQQFDPQVVAAFGELEHEELLGDE